MDKGLPHPLTGLDGGQVCLWGREEFSLSLAGCEPPQR